MENKNKLVITVSPGNSGGGAVHDYLRSREDFVAPFFGEESRFVNDPQGLYYLYLNLYKNFNPISASYYIEEFLKYSVSLSKVKKGNKELYSKKFILLVENFINNITIVFI